MQLNSAQLVPLIHPNPQTPATMERLAFQEPHRQLSFREKKSRLAYGCLPFHFKIFSLAPRKDLFDSSGGFDTFSVSFKY